MPTSSKGKQDPLINALSGNTLQVSNHPTASKPSHAGPKQASRPENKKNVSARDMLPRILTSNQKDLAPGQTPIILDFKTEQTVSEAARKDYDPITTFHVPEGK